MGVPLATSATSQATSTKAAELDSVRMACTQAIHTKSLLQDLQLDQPIALRVLTGGPLAEQLGLSRTTRHLHLWSWFGQFQLSKVGSQQNLAASLTNNLTASGLHRLLPKLRMHTRSADALALSTELGSGPAFFRSSSSSFFIGVLSLTPAMAQLTARELEAAYCKKTSLQKELEAAYCEERASSRKSLRQLTRPIVAGELSLITCLARRRPASLSFPLRSFANHILQPRAYSRMSLDT